MNTRDKDKRYLSRDSAPRNLEIIRSQGNYVYDAKGRKYIDFFMGWCVGNVGWGVKSITREIKRFNGPAYVSPGYLYKPWAELAELLAKISPGKLTKSFRATGGTEAVEIALQAAMTHTKRHKFVSIEGSYHGHSIGAMSVGASFFRSWYKNLFPDCYKVNPPLNAEAARKVEKILSKRDIAAFISEPVICNLGVVIPTKEFFDIVQKACRKYGTLFIADEVATGFGRTGKMFACELYGIEPDIMCLAKGLTGGFGALGATVMTEKVAKSMEFGFSFYSTFGWHPLNVQATIANLKYLTRNKKKFIKNANIMSRYFKERLESMKFKYPAEIRVSGLAIGVELKNKEYAGKIIEKAMKNGLLIADATSNNFIIYPPINISRSIAKKGLDILESCI
jgi:acetylornithine/succinyldiaminopimelate/putrescine aminotransferase